MKMVETNRISAKNSPSRERKAMRSAGIAAAALAVFSPFVELSPISTPVFAASNDSALVAARKNVADYINNTGIFAVMKDTAKSQDTSSDWGNSGWGKADSAAPAENDMATPEKAQPTNATTDFANSRLYLADSLFEEAGVYALGGKEKKAKESITWLVSSCLDQHGIDSTVDLYLTGMGVNQRSILLLGSVADEMRSNNESAVPGILTRYLMYKKGDSKKGLRPVPRSVFYVAVRIEDAAKLPRRFIVGHPPQKAPVAESSLDSMFLASTGTVPTPTVVSVAQPKPPAQMKKPAAHKHIHTIRISQPAYVKADKAPGAQVTMTVPSAPEPDYSNLPECMRHLYLAGLAAAGAAALLLMGMARSFTGHKRRRRKLAMEAIAAHAAGRKQRTKLSIAFYNLSDPLIVLWSRLRQG
jgi:hypothetical protein